MKSPDLIVRCYIKRTHGQWVAVCIDLCLAAQADTEAEARKKLEAQIADYVEEALTVDRAFAADLLTRKAPFGQRVEYYAIMVAYKAHLIRAGIGQVFKTILPVHVRCHA